MPPTLLPWMGLIGTVVGFALGFFGNWIRDHLSDAKRLDEIRRVAYIDIFDAVLVIEFNHSQPQPDVASSYLQTKGEDYLRQRPDLYMQLPERKALDLLYSNIRSVAQAGNNFDAYRVAHVLFLMALDSVIKAGQLKPATVDRLVRKGTYDRVVRMLEGYRSMLPPK